MANFYQDDDLPLRKIKYSNPFKKTLITCPYTEAASEQ